jgi:hypothetical protein
MVTIQVSKDKLKFVVCPCGKTEDLFYCAKHDKFFCKDCLKTKNCENIRFLPIFHNEYHEGCAYMKIEKVVSK